MWWRKLSASVSTWPLFQRSHRGASQLLKSDLNSCQVKSVSAFVSWAIRTRTFSLVAAFFFLCFGERRSEERKLFIIPSPIHTHLPAFPTARNERLRPKRIESNIFWRALPHVCVWGVFHELTRNSFSSSAFYSAHIVPTFASTLRAGGEFPF